ncbi:hypothetical protein [Xanthomonas cannabis]|uniref:hypothetical protein n=1 Tax=Xanthomonas cannabis TaxID=1885674 RepID=UPI00130171A5|nr:hypothetical protein [Xanthomonas cannabis]
MDTDQTAHQPLQIHLPVTWNVLALIARLSTRLSCTEVVCGKDSRHCAAPSAHCRWKTSDLLGPPVLNDLV